jgi:hypothetical protein
MQEDLSSLILWAHKKQLQKVKLAYTWRLHHLEEQLWPYRMRNRSLVMLCEFLLTAYKQLMLAPKFYKKGSGAKYRVY